jgi:ubiquinone/menaquinone biosynthesis C-methylase UbiE
LVPGTLDWEIFAYEHRQRYEFFADQAAGRVVLDAACGVGYGTSILAERGAHTVVGVDLSKDAIDYAERHFAAPNASFSTGDVLRMSLDDDSFDLAVSFETIEHVAEPVTFIREVHRVLKPGGLFVCSTPNRDWQGRSDNPFHLSELSFAEFLEVFGTCFEIQEQYYQSHSAAYLRHIELLKELGRIEKPVRFSKLLNLENRLRKRLGLEHWSVNTPLSPALGRAVPGDFVIEPLHAPSETHLTFILVGRAKPDLGR